jgi:hypothetical protein
MPRIYDRYYDDSFAVQREHLKAIVLANISTHSKDFRVAGRRLDNEHSQQGVRAILEREQTLDRLKDDGQPSSPRSTTPIPTKRRSLDHSLLADRLQCAVEALDRTNVPGTLLRMLGNNIPAEERRANAFRTILACSCVIDPDASYLTKFTELATCIWSPNPSLPDVRGRADVAAKWGRQAMAMLQEACVVLGWREPLASRPLIAPSMDARATAPGSAASNRGTCVEQTQSLANQFIALIEELNKPTNMTVDHFAAMCRLNAGFATLEDGKPFPDWLVRFSEELKSRKRIIVDLAEQLAVVAKASGHDPAAFLAVADWQRGNHPYSALNSVLKATMHNDPPEVRSRYYRRDADFAAAHQLARVLAIHTFSEETHIPARAAQKSKASELRARILAAPDAADDSPDWLDWSMNKWERERKRIPEIDAILSRDEATKCAPIEDGRFSVWQEIVDEVVERCSAPSLLAAQASSSSAPEGEWSIPMSKAEMASRLELKPRAFETFAKQHGLKPLSRQLFQIRVDTMDIKTRRRIETGRA